MVKQTCEALHPLIHITHLFNRSVLRSVCRAVVRSYVRAFVFVFVLSPLRRSFTEHHFFMSRGYEFGLLTQYKATLTCLVFFPVQRVLPVKLAAAHTLCVFIRYNRRFEQRQELCCRLIKGDKSFNLCFPFGLLMCSPLVI